PLRASCESALGSRSCPAARLAESASAAKPEADDASPAAVGKLFLLTTSALKRDFPATVVSKKADIRLSGCPLTIFPLSLKESVANASSKRTRVSVFSESSVMDIEPTAGRFFAAERFPQYLMRAIFAYATALAENPGCSPSTSCLCCVINNL